MGKFSSLLIQNEVLTITSEHPPSADHFESKLQAKISSYEKNIEKPEEELISLTKSDPDTLNFEMKAMNEHIEATLEKLHDKSDKKAEKQLQTMSLQITDLPFKISENIQSEVLNINSKHPSSEYKFERNYKKIFLHLIKALDN